MQSGRLFRAIAGLACLATIGGCDDAPEAAAPPPVRAIKYMTLEQGAGAQMRRISGVVAAGTSADVAFQTGGQVVALEKSVGDAVTSGDVLARLDPEPLRLRLASAESELARAEATLADAQSKFNQQKTLFDRGYATRTNYESALASVKTSRGALGVAESQYRIAKRDLAKATLKAPFAGVIARRAVDPYEEVATGQTIYVLQTEGQNEVRLSLPETLITRVAVGDAVKVAIPLAQPGPIDGVVAEVAPLAEGANAYPVTVRLEGSPQTLRPGMSAQVMFEFETSEADDAFAVPIAALKPETGDQGGTVFVFENGRLSARKVDVVNVRDNMLHIVGPIREGEVIATAGVSLLYDGMPARLLDPAALR